MPSIINEFMQEWKGKMEQEANSVPEDTPYDTSKLELFSNQARKELAPLLYAIRMEFSYSR
jgi:hypothetical protein